MADKSSVSFTKSPQKTLDSDFSIRFSNVHGSDKTGADDEEEELVSFVAKKDAKDASTTKRSESLQTFKEAAKTDASERRAISFDDCRSARAEDKLPNEDIDIPVPSSPKTNREVPRGFMGGLRQKITKKIEESKVQLASSPITEHYPVIARVLEKQGIPVVKSENSVKITEKTSQVESEENAASRYAATLVESVEVKCSKPETATLEPGELTPSVELAEEASLSEMNSCTNASAPSSTCQDYVSPLSAGMDAETIAFAVEPTLPSPAKPKSPISNVLDSDVKMSALLAKDLGENNKLVVRRRKNVEESATLVTEASKECLQPRRIVFQQNVNKTSSLSSVFPLTLFHKTIIVLVILAVYYVLPLSSHLKGAIFGAAVALYIQRLIWWLLAPPAAKPPLALVPLDELPPLLRPEAPFIHVRMGAGEIYKGWMNELQTEYNPDEYHISQTTSVYVRLEGSKLRLSRPKANVPRRASFNESRHDPIFVHQRHFDIAGSKVHLLPHGLARRRLWSKKYPICIALAKTGSKVRRTISQQSPDLSVGQQSNDLAKDMGFETITKEECEENTLCLFSRTDRGKEEWFRRFKVAVVHVEEAETTAPQVRSMPLLSSTMTRAASDLGQTASVTEKGGDRIQAEEVLSSDSTPKKPSRKKSSQTPIMPSRKKSSSEGHLVKDSEAPIVIYSGESHKEETAQEKLESEKDSTNSTLPADKSAASVNQLPEQKHAVRQSHQIGKDASRDAETEDVSQAEKRPGETGKTPENSELEVPADKSAISDSSHREDSSAGRQDSGLGDSNADEEEAGAKSLSSSNGKESASLLETNENKNRGKGNSRSSPLLGRSSENRRSDKLQRSRIRPDVERQLEFYSYMARLIPGETCNSSSQTSQPDSLDSHAWLNAFLGRVLWDFLKENFWAEQVAEKIQKKLDKIKVPYFIEDLTLTDLELGVALPVIRRASLPWVDEQGLWVDLDVAYSGSFRMTLTTKVNLMRLKSSNISSDEKPPPEQDAKHIVTAMDSDAEDSAESSTDEDMDTDSLSTMDENSPNPVIPTGGSSSMQKKILRIVDRVAANRYFQQATENKYIKKAMEGVSNTPIVLTVEVQSLTGTLALNIPPPPTDRLWYGFRGNPFLSLAARPKLGERVVNIGHITDFIEKKLIEEFQRVFVIPNMDDFLVPIMNAGLKPKTHRSGILAKQ